jgi:hypothetical protein
MYMREPEQRSSTEGYEAASQALPGGQAQIENMHEQQQKIYPPETSKRVRAIIGVVLSSLGIALFTNGIPFSAIGIEMSAHNPTLLTWSVLGLVFSILLLLVSVVGVIISTITLTLLKKRGPLRGRSRKRSIRVGNRPYPGFRPTNKLGNTFPGGNGPYA